MTKSDEKAAEDEADEAAEADERAETGETAAKAETQAASEKAATEKAEKATRFDQAKKHLVYSSAAIAGGLAIAGTLDRSTGGVILLIGWLAAVASLHRLGRAGSEQRQRA